MQTTVVEATSPSGWSAGKYLEKSLIARELNAITHILYDWENHDKLARSQPFTIKFSCSVICKNYWWF